MAQPGHPVDQGTDLAEYKEHREIFPGQDVSVIFLLNKMSSPLRNGISEELTCEDLAISNLSNFNLPETDK